MAAPSKLSSLKVRMNNSTEYTVETHGSVNTINLLDIPALANNFYTTAGTGTNKGLVLNNVFVSVEDIHNNGATTIAKIVRDLQKNISVFELSAATEPMYQGTKIENILSGLSLYVFPFFSILSNGELSIVDSQETIIDAIENINICAELTYTSSGSARTALADLGAISGYPYRDNRYLVPTAIPQKYPERDRHYGVLLIPLISSYVVFSVPLPQKSVSEMFGVNYTDIDPGTTATLKLYAYVGRFDDLANNPDKKFPLITKLGAAYTKTLTIPATPFSLVYGIENADSDNPENYTAGGSVGWLSNYDDTTDDTSIKITVEDKP